MHRMIFAAFCAAALTSAPVGGSTSPASEIYSVNRDGSGRVNLSNNPANESSPVESPRGGRFAFVSDRDGYDAMYVMNDDGSGQRRLTDRVTEGDKNVCGLFSPTWSPTGSTIAFAVSCSFPYGDSREAYEAVYTVPESGGATREVISSGSNPMFSADGRYIASLYRMGARIPHPLRGSTAATAASWSRSRATRASRSGTARSRSPRSRGAATASESSLRRASRANC